MRTVALIQARMGSTRLPGKVLADVAGVPLIAHVIARARAVKRIFETRVITSSSQQDDALAAWCRQADVPYFRGSENDVLDRYHAAAAEAKADVIVRLTGDCPLLDPTVVDATIAEFERGGYDYVSNCLEPTFPDGLDTEVFSRAALGRAWREATLHSEHEHATPYIWKHPTLFKIGRVRATRDLSALRWTVDEPADLAFVRRVYEHAGSSIFGMDRVLEIVAAHPEIADLNRGFERNEGYQKSLSKEAIR